MAIMGRPKKKKRSKGDALTHTSVRISDRIKQALLAEAERNRHRCVPNSMCALRPASSSWRRRNELLR